MEECTFSPKVNPRRQRPGQQQQQAEQAEEWRRFDDDLLLEAL